MTISLWFRCFLQWAWWRLTFKHGLVLAACGLALFLQMQYRVPSLFLFLLLPWIGLAVTILSGVLLINHLVVRIPEEDPFRQTLAGIERWTGYLVRGFVYYSLLLFANGILDRADPELKPTKVLAITAENVDLTVPIPFSWVSLRSWDNPDRAERLFLTPAEQRSLWVGEEAVVRYHAGYFGVHWVSMVDRNEELYTREVLRLSPNASGAWKNLIEFNLKHKRWQEASAASQEYLKLAPKAYDYIFSVASGLLTYERYKEGIPLLEYVVARRPTYEVYQHLGWALSWSGNNPRAAEILEKSIALKSDDWEAYYHLGYVYGGMGRMEDAVKAFEKTLQLRPNFPEVRIELDRVKETLAAINAAKRARARASKSSQ